MREVAQIDAFKLLEVADLMVDLAELQKSEGDTDSAINSLDEVIRVLEKYGKEHIDGSAFVRADKIRKLKDGFEEN